MNLVWSKFSDQINHTPRNLPTKTSGHFSSLWETWMKVCKRCWWASGVVDCAACLNPKASRDSTSEIGVCRFFAVKTWCWNLSLVSNKYQPLMHLTHPKWPHWIFDQQVSSQSPTDILGLCTWQSPVSTYLVICRVVMGRWLSLTLITYSLFLEYLE